MRHLTKHVFATYTFKRDIPVSECWTQTGLHFNRLVQKLRRLHGVPVQYIRTVEAHRDTYPHIHVIWQFRDPITVEDVRYFDRRLYAKWKSLWQLGLSDYQPPRGNTAPILYLIKYISKSTSTHRVLWKKLLRSVPNVQNHSNVASVQQTSANIVESDNLSPIIADDKIKFSTTLLFCKQYKIRQLSWSRKFVFPALPKGGRGGTPEIMSLDDFDGKAKRTS